MPSNKPRLAADTVKPGFFTEDCITNLKSLNNSDKQKAGYCCQALVPNPSPPPPQSPQTQSQPSQTQSKTQINPKGTGADTKIL